MLAHIVNEIVKLRRSLVLLVCLFAPLCAAAFPVMVLLNNPRAMPWVQALAEGAAVWAYFLYPMAVTALTTLIAQIEHGPRMWTHLLALPSPRAQLFVAKFIVAVLLVLAMTVVLYAALYGAIALADRFSDDVRMIGDPQFAETASSLLLLNGAGLTMIAVQLWVALRFRSFAAPLVVGVVGTFLALAIQAGKPMIFLPWLAPAYAFSIEKPSSLAVVLFGFFGALAVTPAMAAHLSRHER